MMVSSCPARTTSCTGRRGAPSESLTARPIPLAGRELSAGAPHRPVHEIVRVRQDETVMLLYYY